MPTVTAVTTEPPTSHEHFDEIRAGELAVTIASSQRMIEAAQKLRYQIFYEEMGGTPPEDVARQKRDFDEFDEYFDHLLVLDCERPKGPEQVVGTYRLLRRDAMTALGHFYSETEFNITPIKQFKGQILELGRSCVHPDYRNRAVMQLLWRGIGSYVSMHNIELMFGCASFPGVDPDKNALGLSYLHHFHLAPSSLRARALEHMYVNMNRIPMDQLDVKEAFASLPPLIKGYLRLGGYIGDGAILDRQCNTTDVCVIVQTDLITEKYTQRYNPDVKPL
jgi:putative hemolysin